MTQELKACPFCGGGQAEIYEADDVGGFVAQCLYGCGAQTWGSTHEHAVEAWNTRTPDSVIAELVEAAERALNYITNTESELGISLGCGEALRNALAKLEASK